MNPVRAGLVERTDEWLWSSVASFLAQEATSDAFKRLRQSETTGRPLGSQDWIDKFTAMTGQELNAKKRGPKEK